MNIKKAVISSLVIYAVLFLVASVIMFSLGIVDDTVFGSIMVVLSSVTVFLVVKEYYFKGMKIKSPLKDGLTVGIFMTVLSVLIDVLVMVYGFASDIGWGYFMSWHLILGYLLGIAISVIVAYRMK
jgi:hypothetical protein